MSLLFLKGRGRDTIATALDTFAECQDHNDSIEEAALEIELEIE